MFEMLVTHGFQSLLVETLIFMSKNPSDVSASCLLDLVTSMDLQQHMMSPTHQAGGTLDLVITFNDFSVEELQ